MKDLVIGLCLLGSSLFVSSSVPAQGSVPTPTPLVQSASLSGQTVSIGGYIRYTNPWPHPQLVTFSLGEGIGQTFLVPPDPFFVGSYQVPDDPALIGETLTMRIELVMPPPGPNIVATRTYTITP